MSSQPQDSALTGPQVQGSTRHVANTVLANTVLARYPHFVMFAVDEELSKSIKAKVVGCYPARLTKACALLHHESAPQ